MKQYTINKQFQYMRAGLLSKKSILKGTLILTIAGIATKLLGFYNRIFLTRLIGVKELGVYQLIFPLYILAFSICCQGIATAMTKQVSYYMGRHQKSNAVNVFKFSLIISISLSIFVSILISSLAYPLSLHILKNTDCAPLLKIITIAIPFISIKACINSFFVGIDKPAYQGISHFVEQLFRIGTVYFLAALWSSEKVNAVLAVISVVAGEVAATVLSIIFYMIYTGSRKSDTPFDSKNEKIRLQKPDGEYHGILRLFLRDAVPITVNNVMFTLFSSLEAILMPAMLYYYYMDRDTAMEMFGIVTGIVIPFLLFPSTITTSLSTMLLPAVSYANAKHDKRAINSALKNSVIFCLLLGGCAWLFYVLLGEPICRYAFKNEYAGQLLKQMSYLCPLIYMSGNLSAIMNGMDKAFQNLMYNIISIVIRIIFSVTLVPKYGLTAYIGGMTVSYITLDLLMLITARKVLPDTHNN